MDDSKDSHEHQHVRFEQMTGGPHGLGDPDDRTLRIMEKEVAIPKEMKKKAAKICKKEVSEFNDCGKKYGYLMPFKCRKENDNMNDCIGKLFQDQAFWDTCEKEYLDRRSEYRRTGLTRQQINEAEKKKKFEEAIKWKEQKNSM